MRVGPLNSETRRHAGQVGFEVRARPRASRRLRGVGGADSADLSGVCRAPPALRRLSLREWPRQWATSSS